MPAGFKSSPTARLVVEPDRMRYPNRTPLAIIFLTFLSEFT